MARSKGTYNYSANLEVKKRAPLDAKQIIDTKSGLTDILNWSTDGGVTEYTFAGMIVSVVGDGANDGIYRLKNSGFTDINNWELAGNLADIASVSTAISSEIIVRASADLSLSTNIATLSGFTDFSEIAVDTILGNNELLGRTGNTLTGFTNLMPSLSSAISTEISDRISGYTSLTTSISNVLTSLSTEISDRISGDTSLSSAIAAIPPFDPSGITASLSTEISERISGDASLLTNLSSEIVNRISGDESIQTNLSTEIVSRISGDISLSTNISVISGETIWEKLDIYDNIADGYLLIRSGETISGITDSQPSLSTAISTEIVNRISGDASLLTNLSTEIVSRISVDSSIQTNLSTEIVSRISGDASISTIVDGFGTIASYDFWSGSTAEYTAVNPKLSTTLYFITP